MAEIRYTICNICDSSCGLEVEVEKNKALSIRGDRAHKFSRGHVCPKGLSHKELYEDPDRVRAPLRKRGRDWEEISWNEALTEAGARLAEIQKKHGRDSLALYYGNPIGHDYKSLLCLVPFVKGLKSKNIYSATSVDQLPHMLVSLLMFGNQAALPVPDIERTDYFLVIGANPAVSNGSIMTAPDCRRRLKEMRERGARIVVIDPRKTETAKLADEHIFIRPGTDAAFLLSLIHVLKEEGLLELDALGSKVAGAELVLDKAKSFSPARTENFTRIPAETTRRLAREFGSAEKAVCYGRMGVSTQEFATLTVWLINALNILAGNLDRPGGAMFTTPAVDLVRLTKLLRQPGFFNRWRSRVSGLPEFNGEFPAAAFAEEMETPGPGQIKALITMAGNPARSLPNSRRIEQALAGLEFMVSIDFYINETTRHADIILPPATALENDHYPILEYGISIRNFAHYAEAALPKPEQAKANWEIMLDLLYSLERHRGKAEALSGWLKRSALRLFSPRRQLDLLLRFGPHKLSIKKLLDNPHGVDLGPLEPRLDAVISTKDGKINLAPHLILKDFPRLEKKMKEPPGSADNNFLLINRRTLRSNNTWMHNLPGLVKGKEECVLLMNPKDAERLGLEDGQKVKVSSCAGQIETAAAITEEMMPGVVCMPFGWGHVGEGLRLRVAEKHPGANANELVDDKFYDRVSGTSALHGVPVMVIPA